MTHKIIKTLIISGLLAGLIISSGCGRRGPLEAPSSASAMHSSLIEAMIQPIA